MFFLMTILVILLGVFGVVVLLFVRKQEKGDFEQHVSEFEIEEILL